jgi:ATP-dependent DNA ligase
MLSLLSLKAQMFRPLFPYKAIQPCLAKPAKAPPARPDWIHEIKHDGFRILARRDAKVLPVT